LVGAGKPHAYIWENGTAFDLNDLITNNSSWLIWEALDINDAGCIVGRADFSAVEHAIILTPIYEPTINEIIEFINTNNIVGIGEGNLAQKRFDIFMNMLLTTDELIETWDNEGACKELVDIIGKCDGLPKPRDLITGDLSSMNGLIVILNDLMESLGCE
jgi:hypothetical protein